VLVPGEGGHAAFWVILAGLAVTLTAMLAFFRYKRWL
jgi:Mg2+ and Co2+ transporter CorA